MKSKCQIYAEILHFGIVSIRSHRKDAAYCHNVADLLHNIPYHLLENDFNDLDFFFLNIEVSCYARRCQYENISPDSTLLALAEELRGIVPEDLKSKRQPSRYEARAPVRRRRKLWGLFLLPKRK